MPRGPRQLTPGGTYHVTARGNRRQPIVANADDCRLFFRILDDVVARHRWRCGAYCLLSNHFHLLVQTPVAPTDLSAGMHRLNGRYAQWFNERHSFTGHVFQGRFHSRLIESDGDLLGVARYVFQNPVRAGVAGTPDAWVWSSYAATVGMRPRPRFLSTAMVLDYFGSDLNRARARLASFVADAPSQ